MSRIADIRKRYRDVVCGGGREAADVFHVHALGDVGVLLQIIDENQRDAAKDAERMKALALMLGSIRRALGLAEDASDEATLDVLDDALCAKHEWETRRAVTFEDMVEASLKAQIIARFMDVQASTDVMRVAIHDADDVIEVYRRARKGGGYGEQR